MENADCLPTGLNTAQFREAAHKAIDDICAYYESLNERPVRSTVEPGYLAPLLPDAPPQQGQAISEIQADFDKLVMPGITSWQSPNFFAYVRWSQVAKLIFPANATFESILADLYSGAVSNPGFNWICSPAATELEMAMMDWIVRLLGLDQAFLTSRGVGGGLIIGSASECCLTMAVAARERALACLTKQQTGQELDKGAPAAVPADIRASSTARFIMYGSTQTHSIGSKAALILGLIWRSLPVKKEDHFALRGDVLEAAIQQDVTKGYIPMFVVGTVGTTNTGAVDRIDEIGVIAQKYPTMSLYVDAAWAGVALGCPEQREALQLPAINQFADAFSTNFHKWGGVNFDCSTLFVRDRKVLTNALDVTPAVLRSEEGDSGRVIDYRNWQLPLGRRFRSAKIWFVLRSHGVDGFQRRLRKDIGLAEQLESWIKSTEGFELCMPRTLALCVFRLAPSDVPQEQLNALNKKLADRLNKRNDLFFTPTSIPDDIYCLRWAIGTPSTQIEHIEAAWTAVQEEARAARAEFASQ